MSQINYSEITKIKWLWDFIYYGQIYVTFGSVITGHHCISLKNVTLIKLLTMNSHLTSDTLSQTIYQIHFVSNQESYSLCLRPYVLFTLSQTIHDIGVVSNQVSYILCLKQRMVEFRVRVMRLGLELFDMILFVSNYPSYSLCLRPCITITPSQTIHHFPFVSDHMSYWICLKLPMILA